MKSYKVEVLMAAHNEAASIAKALRSVANQQIDDRYQFTIHVIANGCTDDTVAIAKQTIDTLTERSNFRFVVHTRPVASKIKALNFGLQQGDSPVVFCIDADSVFSPHCFAETLVLFDNPRVMVAGALPELVIKPSNCKLLLGKIQRTANICTRLYECTTPSGCMLAFRRAIIKEYPTTIAAEDTWLAFQSILRFGWESVKVTRKAVVRVVAPQHWLDYLKQESRFSRATKQLLEVFPELIAVRESQITQLKQSTKLYRDDVRQALKRAGLSVAFLKYRQLFQQMCEENADMLATQLVNAEGQWEAITTTKQVISEEC